MTTSPNVLAPPKSILERARDPKFVAFLTSVAIFGFLLQQYKTNHSGDSGPGQSGVPTLAEQSSDNLEPGQVIETPNGKFIAKGNLRGSVSLVPLDSDPAAQALLKVEKLGHSPTTHGE